MIAHPADLWESIADSQPDLPVVKQGEVTRTWGEFDDVAARLVDGFASAGIGPGSRIALYLHNSPEYLEVLFAALKARSAFVNVNYRYIEDELVYLLTNSRSDALVYHETFSERIEQIQPRIPTVRLLVQVGGTTPLVDGAVLYEDLVRCASVAPRIKRSEDDPMILYTGGTTGLPKGLVGGVKVFMTPGWVEQIKLYTSLPQRPQELSPAFAADLREQGIAVTGLPLAPLMHASGLALATLPTLQLGGKVVFLRSQSFDAAEALATIEEEKVRLIGIVGDAMAKPLLREAEARRATNEPYDLSCLRTINSAGVALNAKVKGGLFHHAPNVTITDFFGSSEGIMGYRPTALGDPLTTTSFIPISGLRVIAEDGRDVVPGSGQRGLIHTPASMFTAYLDDPVKTAEVFRARDGQLYAAPGDWASLTSDGALEVHGRGSSVINTGGEKVFPEEVEAMVRELSGVEDCLIVGLPDETWGERVVAVVVTPSGRDQPAVTVSQVQSAVRSRLAGFKVPRHVAFTNKNIRHSNGKPDFALARTIARSSANGSPHVTT